MDLKELFKDVTSFNKEAAMKENMRMVELKDNVTANAFRDAQKRLASYVNIIKIDSPESNLTEFSRNKLSGKMKAMLSVSTTAGLKRLPIHFVVKASVPTMVETPEQVVAALENVEGSIDKEVNEILEKQKQHANYHNEAFEEADNILDSLKKQVENKEITLERAGEQLFDAGWFNYIPTEEQTKQKLGIKAELKEEIKVEAKRKEIDLGVRENVSSSQFPVKLLVYPKTYLPELKKGDILNVGGYKYKYIGDEPTISGDTENGINARFELIVTTKKASLNTEAAENKEKQNKEVEQELKSDEANQDFADLTPDELMGLLISYAEYNVQVPGAALKEVAKNPQLSAWFMINFSKSLEETLDGEATPKIIDSAFSSSKAITDIIEHFVDEKTTLDKLPQKYQDAVMKDMGALVKLVKKCPQMLTEDVADKLVSDSPTDAGELATTEYAEKYEKSTGFKKLQQWAEEQGLFNEKAPTSEELGITDISNDDGGSVEGDDFSDAEEVEKEYHKEQSQYGADFSGTGLEKEIQQEQTKPEDEENKDQDTLDDNQEAPKDDVKKKTSSEQPIEKEAETTDDLTFSADISSFGDNKHDGVTYEGGDDDLFAKLKEQFPQMKDIPNEWIELRDAEWFGTITWSIDIDAREWGLSNFSITCKPAKVTCRLNLRYFENAEAADLQDDTEDYFDVVFELDKVEAQIDSQLGENSQLFAQRIEIGTDNSALVFF